MIDVNEKSRERAFLAQLRARYGTSTGWRVDRTYGNGRLILSLPRVRDLWRTFNNLIRQGIQASELEACCGRDHPVVLRSSRVANRLLTAVKEVREQDKKNIDLALDHLQVLEEHLQQALLKRLLESEVPLVQGLIIDTSEKRKLVKRINELSMRLDSVQRRLANTCKSQRNSYMKRVEKAETKLKSRWHQFSRRMEKTIATILFHDTPTVTFGLGLDSRDLELTETWAARKEKYPGEFNRLQSARHAEKAAIQYFKELGYRVEDVSLSQIDPQAYANHDWRSHDITANGYPLDVKNARRKNSTELREQLWRDHKYNRLHQAVGVVGVVTTELAHQSLSNERAVEKRHSTVIGTVDKSKIDDIGRKVKDAAERFGLNLNFRSSPDWGHRIDGWLYEYPRRHYEQTRNRVMRALKAWLRINQLGLGASLPIGVHGLLLTITEYSPNTEKQEDRIAHALQEWFSDLPVSRRSVFLFALLIMLAEFKRQGNSTRKEVKKLLFLSGDEKCCRPLGLHDEQRYVCRMIDVIHKVITDKSDVLENVTAYRLTGYNLLHGLIEGYWHTVLAYCHCGVAPLFVGDCETCNCGKHRLRCPECGECDRHCSGKSEDANFK